jgi:sulfonate transport system substrate-binding protein
MLEVCMSRLFRNVLAAAAFAAGLAPCVGAVAQTPPKEIRIDWATYNPVSMLLKEKGFLEKEFAKDGVTIRWVQTVSSSNALQFLNAGSIDFGSTAGSAALVARINGNPIKSVYTYSRPEWTALVTTKDSKITKSKTSKARRSPWCAAPIRTSSSCGRCSAPASPTATSRRSWCSSTPTAAPR